MGIAEAERVVGFRPLLIDGRSPDDVRINRFSPFFIVLLYGEPGVRLRLTEVVGGTIEKYALVEQRVERVEVDGEPGIWVEGRARRLRAVRAAPAVGERHPLGAGGPDAAPRGPVHEGAGARPRAQRSLSDSRWLPRRGESNGEGEPKYVL